MKTHIKNLLIVALAALLLSWPGVALGKSPNPPQGVDHLLGRWDGALEGFESEDQPFRLLLQEFVPDPKDPKVGIAAGCLSVGEHGILAPLAARALPLENGDFDLALFGTAVTQYGVSVIRLDGVAETRGAGVRDDSAGGGWRTAGEEGAWWASHHDRRRPKCPQVELGDGLQFTADVYAFAAVEPDGSQSHGTILESYTNIVSSAVRVESPDGSTLDIQPFTDLFSPQVEFVDHFRYVGGPEGFPMPNGAYVFTLLDVYGEPISGATTSDTWLACTVGPPLNVSATVEADGMHIDWDPVSPAPGFDPGADPPLGFFQIELSPEIEGDGSYGAAGIYLDEHLIPMASFGGNAPGMPDGWDFGQALEELADGTYGFDVITFADAPPGSEASGLECQIRSNAERTRFEKAGDNFTILD